MQQERQIKTYDDAMVRIKEITHEEDLDRIISEFIEKEDTNFALFQYVRELNNQVKCIKSDVIFYVFFFNFNLFFQAENLNDDIERIRQNIAHFQSEEVRTEKERQNIIRKIEVRRLKFRYGEHAIKVAPKFFLDILWNLSFLLPCSEGTFCTLFRKFFKL